MKSKVALSAFALVLSSQLHAADAPPATEGATLEEVVITAQKRTERLQDVPVSASVINGDAVTQANATDISDINRMVPSVQLKGTFNGRVPLAMRGVSTNANEGAIGLTSGVAILLDGVPVPSDSFAANNLDDVAQVEVLKGPQATLGGRTASAGVINIVTNSPTDKFQGSFGLSATDDSERRATLHISGPIGSSLAYSLAGFSSHLPYPVVNDRTGNKSIANNGGARGKLKFSAGDSFDATLMARYSHFKSTGENFVPIYITPGANLFPYVNGVGISQAVAYPGININYSNTHYSSPAIMFSDFKDKDASLTLNFHSGDYTISSITAYQQEKQLQAQDIFESNVFFWNVVTGGFAPPFDNVQTLDAKVEQTSQELRVVSSKSGPVNFIAGAFYSSNKVDDVGLRVWVGNPASVHNIAKATTTDVYGRVTAKVADNTSIVAGLRYNKDKLDWSKTQFFNPPAGQFQGCDTAGAGPPGTPANPPPRNCTWNLSDSSSATVGDISLQQKFGADRMAYLTLARGYKPRAFNTVHDFVSLQNGLNSTPAGFAADKLAAQPVDQEKINHVEAGLKSSLMDGRMTFNASIFNTDYDGYQVQIFDNSAVIGVLRLVNGKARTRGAEADLNWRAAQNTRLSLSAAYIDAKITSFPGADCYPTQTAAQGCVAGKQDLSGHPLPDSPKFKLNGNIEQRVALDAVDVVLGGNLAYRTDSLFQADGNPKTRQPGFALLNLSAGVASKDGKYTGTVFVNNVTDHYYLTNAEDFFSGAFAAPGTFAPANVVIGQPARDSHRYFGARLAVNF